jgi:hypothetical protein
MRLIGCGGVGCRIRRRRTSGDAVTPAVTLRPTFGQPKTRKCLILLMSGKVSNHLRSLTLDSGHQTDTACVSLVSAKCQKENSSLSLDPNGHYNFELKGRLRHATRNALRQKR